MAESEILIGTSGYSFKDWVGPFYPEKIEKGKMLDYYKDRFNTVEINSTYYRIPHPAVFYHMVNKVKEDFEFIVKTHRSFTHDRKDLKEPSTQFNEAIKPMAESGMLKGLLAQFPWSFKFSPNNLQYLLDGKDYFGDQPLFAEFRHDSWDKPEVYASLKDNYIGFCCVDEPQLQRMYPPIAKATTSIGYVRFHGRNMIDWWRPRKGSDRYNYDYKKEELADWVKKIMKLKQDTDKIYLFFNNCHHGQAVRSAQLMKEMLQLEL
ncbi:MAG: DUF72 domain-containing protein [candidate division Zixibacteria bacterium]|nr:DUF72 domain-containing protein [candidate division Zixibacteria bacterium]